MEMYKDEDGIETDWKNGIQKFNDRKYWDAHECWERSWLKLSGSSKLYIQALIQGAAVWVHLEKGRTGPAVSLARLALEKLEKLDSFIQQGEMERLGIWIEIPGLCDLLREVVNPLSVPSDLLRKASNLQAFLKK